MHNFASSRWTPLRRGSRVMRQNVGLKNMGEKAKDFYDLKRNQNINLVYNPREAR